MNNKRIAITAVLVAVSMLAGIVATTPITTVAESETEKEINCTLEYTSSGESNPVNVQSCVIDNTESFGP
jgi:hypothetical protein